MSLRYQFLSNCPTIWLLTQLTSTSKFFPELLYFPTPQLSQSTSYIQATLLLYLWLAVQSSPLPRNTPEAVQTSASEQAKIFSEWRELMILHPRFQSLHRVCIRISNLVRHGPTSLLPHPPKVDFKFTREDIDLLAQFSNLLLDNRSFISSNGKQNPSL